MRLLDEAIYSHDGNAIIAVLITIFKCFTYKIGLYSIKFQVTLFVKRTLIKEIFLTEILCRPVALTHYLAYLEQMKSFDEIIEIYRQESFHKVFVVYFYFDFSLIYRAQGKLEDAAVSL